MAIQEGIYMLWNAFNNEALDLSDGKWEYGQVQTWESSNEARDSDGQYNKRWLIAKIPGSDYYQIINSHYGVLAGALPVKDLAIGSSKSVPSRLMALPPGGKQLMQEMVARLVRFVWAMDESRCLDIEGGKSHGSALIYQIGTNSRNQMWRLQRDDGLDDRSNRWASWMRNVPDDTRLSMLNIPGTHQSIALHGIAVSDNPRCQNRPPYEQLCEGIRYLDLRFDRWMGSNEQPSLYARHGIASMGFSLAAVLQSLKIFLQKFPSEVVFISVSNETGTDGFQESWQNDFKFFKDIFFTHGSDQRPRMADLTLGQVRGKVICHNDGLIWKWGPPWQGS